MRTGNMTMEDALAAEKTVADRQTHRKSGYVLMKDRDSGWARLSNGVVMHWPVVRPEFPDKGIWLYPKYVPEGSVEIDGKLYDAEELRKFLRWA